MYKELPQYLKDDIVEAGKWAKKYLTEMEGSGHQLFVTANKDKTVCCSFAKPEWGGDHCGRGMDHGAEAIVIAVCEYAVVPNRVIRQINPSTMFC